MAASVLAELSYRNQYTASHNRIPTAMYMMSEWSRPVHLNTKFVFHGYYSCLALRVLILKKNKGIVETNPWRDFKTNCHMRKIAIYTIKVIYWFTGIANE